MLSTSMRFLKRTTIPMTSDKHRKASNRIRSTCFLWVGFGGRGRHRGGGRGTTGTRRLRFAGATSRTGARPRGTRGRETRRAVFSPFPRSRVVLSNVGRHAWPSVGSDHVTFNQQSNIRIQNPPLSYHYHLTISDSLSSQSLSSLVLLQLGVWRHDFFFSLGRPHLTWRGPLEQSSLASHATKPNSCSWPVTRSITHTPDL